MKGDFLTNERCGPGGDRKKDGSVIDGCDLCCKNHDTCYHDARIHYEKCSPPVVTYSSTYNSDEDKERCEDIGCAQDACMCDVQFVECMKKLPCSPLKVYNDVSYFWWLGV